MDVPIREGGALRGVERWKPYILLGYLPLSRIQVLGHDFLNAVLVSKCAG